MIKPIVIKKCPHKFEHIPYDPNDFKYLVDEVNLFDICEYIISANKGDWAPNCYWSKVEKNIRFVELQWLVYSYLIHKGLLIIEDKYFGYHKSRTEKYIDRCSYYNPLENRLYVPILDRMVNEKYLSIGEYRCFNLGTNYNRMINLNKLIS